MENLYIFHNNEFVKEADLHLGVTNRSFRFGDNVFESVRLANGNLCFIDDHFDRFVSGMQTLKMDLPKWLTVGAVEKAFDKLKEMNNIGAGGRGRITAYRNNGLTYRPEGNAASVVIELRPLAQDTYELNTKGLSMGLYTENHKNISTYSHFKTGNSLLYTLAGAFAAERKWDEAILINDDNRVVEAISSNVFIAKSGALFTPPIADGCIAGVMRRNLIEIAEQGGIRVKEQSLALAALEEADEVFLTNTINGIRWVMSYGKRRYFNTMAKQLTEWLAESVE